MMHCNNYNFIFIKKKNICLKKMIFLTFRENRVTKKYRAITILFTNNTINNYT